MQEKNNNTLKSHTIIKKNCKIVLDFFLYFLVEFLPPVQFCLFIKALSIYFAEIALVLLI